MDDFTMDDFTVDVTPVKKTPVKKENGGPSQDLNPSPIKQTRISKACDFCHRRSIRCRTSDQNKASCQNCVDFGLPCLYDRPAKKRGGKKKSASIGNGPPDPLSGLSNNTPFYIPDTFRIILASKERQIQDLVHVYFETVYPSFPFFHGPTTRLGMVNKDYLTDRSFFACVMAICALTSARIRDGAVMPGRWGAHHFDDLTPKLFADAARKVTDMDVNSETMCDCGLDTMRTLALLALYSLQNGSLREMRAYLYTYRIIVEEDQLYDEENWPQGISIVDIEMRRRLFWSMYMFDVYRSIIWGGNYSFKEFCTDVKYPSEVPDDHITTSGYVLPPTARSVHETFPSAALEDSKCWLHGFNFTITLYRWIDNAMPSYRLRMRTAPLPESQPMTFDLAGTLDPHQQPQGKLQRIMNSYAALPEKFKLTSLSRNGGCGLNIDMQAANITAALQLLQMIQFTTEKATVEKKTKVATHLLQQFTQIPSAVLKAISLPGFYHVSVVGGFLGSVIEHPLSEISYLHVRKVLIAMADFLDHLESGITHTIGAATQLRDRITSIDRFMYSQRKPNSLTQALASTGLMNPAGDDDSINTQFDPSNYPSIELGMPMFQQPAGLQYASGSSDVVGALEELAGQSHPEIQIPPELLANWPWGTGIDPRYGQFGNQQPPHGPFGSQQSPNGPFGSQQSPNGPFGNQQPPRGPFGDQQFPHGPFGNQQPPPQ